jgi:hypothetical protein
MEQCPGPVDESNVPPVGWDWTVDPDEAQEPPVALYPDQTLDVTSDTYYVSPVELQYDRYHEALSALTDPGDTGQVYDAAYFSTEGHMSRLDLGLSDVPSTGTYRIDVHVRMLQSAGSYVPETQLSLRAASAPATNYGGTTVFGAFDGWATFSVSGLSAPQVNGLMLRVFRPNIIESSIYASQVIVYAHRTG